MRCRMENPASAHAAVRLSALPTTAHSAPHALSDYLATAPGTVRLSGNGSGYADHSTFTPILPRCTVRLSGNGSGYADHSTFTAV